MQHSSIALVGRLGVYSVQGVHALFTTPARASAGGGGSGAGRTGSRVKRDNFPDSWDYTDSPVNEVPVEGLVEVKPTSAEYLLR